MTTILKSGFSPSSIDNIFSDNNFLAAANGFFAPKDNHFAIHRIVQVQVVAFLWQASRQHKLENMAL